MKNLSDGELINQAAGFSCGCDKCLARVEPPRRELLSRLERGRKAIEVLEKLNALFIGCTVAEGKNRLQDAWDIIHTHNKETTDEN